MDSSKLKPVPQESKSDSLQNEVFPDEEVRTCIWELVKGARKGEECGKKAFEGREYCVEHQALVDIRNSATKTKGTISESVETIETITLPAPTSSIQPASTRIRATSKAPVVASSYTQADMMEVLTLFSRTMVEMTKSLKEK